MEIKRAIDQVINIGWSYFYDELDRFSVDQIVNKIIDEIQQATKLQGLSYAEIECDAFIQVSDELSQEELDQILFHEYALLPEQVGSSREFFRRLAMEMDDAIRQVKTKFIQQGQNVDQPPDAPLNKL